jgi:hypothetical protein
VLAVRDTAKGETAASRLAAPGSTSVVELDLSDLDQAAGCARALLDRHNNVAALICNAGVMGGPLLRTPQGFERQMATNHLGHAALVAALWPLLHASASRVVVVSSTEAREGQLSRGTTREQLLNPEPYHGRQVYRNTKKANLPVRAGATPPLRQGRFAGQRRRRAPGRQFDQPVRPPTRAGRTWLAGPCQQGCHRGAAPVGRRRCAVHPPGARSRHAERRLCRPRQFGQLRGRPELLDVYPSARDPATAARLWELTEQALGGPLPV